MEELSIRDIRIGDILSDRDNFPMHVVSIHDDGTVYLDFEGNEGSLFESHISHLKRVDSDREAIISAASRWVDASDDHICMMMLCDKRYYQYDLLSTSDVDICFCLYEAMIKNKEFCNAILGAVSLYSKRHS